MCCKKLQIIRKWRQTERSKLSHPATENTFTFFPFLLPDGQISFSSGRKVGVESSVCVRLFRRCMCAVHADPFAKAMTPSLSEQIIYFRCHFSKPTEVRSESLWSRPLSSSSVLVFLQTCYMKDSFISMQLWRVQWWSVQGVRGISCSGILQHVIKSYPPHVTPEESFTVNLTDPT